MGKATTPTINVNIQINVASPNATQENSVNYNEVDESKVKSSSVQLFVGWLGGMLKALAESVSATDPNIIIALAAMIFGIGM